MKRLPALIAAALLLCGCAAEPSAPALTIATPGPEQATVLRDPYRMETEPAEVIELDAEHGYWAYRSDTLSVTVDSRDYLTEDGELSNWCVAEVYWRSDDAYSEPALSESTDASAAARENGWVLFAPGSEGKRLVTDGAAADGLSDVRAQLSALGEIEPGHWIVLAAGQSASGDAVGLSERELSELLLSCGCRTAFLLASGSDAAVIFLGQQINDPMTGADACARAGYAWGQTENLLQ